MNVTDRRLNRRQALIGGSLLGGGALAAVMTAPVAAASQGSTGLEGAWLITVTPDGGTPAPHHVLALYSKGGGVVIATDNPPASGSTGIGAWESTADNQYIETFELFTFDPSGQATGILRIRAQSSLDGTANNMTGHATIDFQPAGTSTFMPAGTTHFAGSRITALPL